jgi:DNA invertase Pin-like site-specific DNA recombinase
VRVYRNRKRVWVGPLENDRFWWKDPVKKAKHSELTKAGLERARQAGKRVTILKVEEREGFAERFAPVLEKLEQKSITRKQASKELGISGPTLKRVLDDHLAAAQQALVTDGERTALVV